MFNRISLLLIIGYLVINPMGTYAQNPILGSFTVIENNGSVFLTWSILAGNTCDGTKIFRSTDLITFTQIGEIVGVCGSASVEEVYGFTDVTPVPNSINYYRLELGLSGFTHTISIEVISIGSSGYQLRPNPVTNDGKLYFENPRNQLCTINFYRTDGRKVYSTTTKDEFIHVNTAFVSRGLYVFNISGLDNGDVSGTIVVQE